MTGRAITAIVTTEAPTTPVVAAKRAPTNTTEMARPPRTRPNKRPIVSSSSSARPDFSRITPIKINKGTANSVKLVIMPQILRGSRSKKSNPKNVLPNASATAPSVKATGNPASNRTNNTANITKAQTSINLDPVWSR